jgi:hypothetical protein
MNRVIVLRVRLSGEVKAKDNARTMMQLEDTGLSLRILK